jgi:PPM family protein phosphatase
MSSDWRSDDTKEIPLASPRGTGRWPDTGSARVRVELGAATHQGHVRKANEDHFLIVRCGRALETILTSLPEEHVPSREEEIAYGMLVADGMGGLSGGEVASRTAICTLLNLVLHTHGWILSDQPAAATEVMRRFADRFRMIHEVILDQGRSDSRLARMGTTLTLAASLGHSLILGHIGDSRAYLLREEKLFQLTRDHTLVQPMVEAGHISAEDAEHHPSRHVLTAYLGGGGARTQGDFQHATVLEGDQLLLCTDGLTEMVASAAIKEILFSHVAAQDACDALVAAALKAGGKDNITVILARYRFFD